VIIHGITADKNTPFFGELKTVVSDYFTFEEEFSKEAHQMEPINLKNISMEIDPDLFEHPSETRQSKIAELMGEYARVFRIFQDHQEEMRTSMHESQHKIEIDTNPNDDSGIGTNMRSHETTKMEIQDDSGDEPVSQKIQKMLDIEAPKMMRDGYYLRRAFSNKFLMTWEEKVVLRNAVKQFELLLKKEAKKNGLTVSGAGTNGTVFVLDIDEEDLKHFDSIPNFSPKLPPKKKKILRPNPTTLSEQPQSKLLQDPNQTSTRDPLMTQPSTSLESLSNKEPKNDSTDSLEPVSQSETIEPKTYTFAAKKSMFFVGTNTVKNNDFNNIYFKNQGLVRELEAMTAAKARDPLNLFYVRNFGTLDITSFIDNMNLGGDFLGIQKHFIDTPSNLKANVAFSVMNNNPFDLEAYLVNLSKKESMMFYHTFLQMMLNLLNGLIIMKFEFYHCDLKPLNVMFRPLGKTQNNEFDGEVSWLKTVSKQYYEYFRINPNNIHEKFNGESIIAYPMELFPGEHFLMSIIDIGNDSWIQNECQPKTRYYRKCNTVTPNYAPNEYGYDISKIQGFDSFSFSMMFMEMLMAEVGFGGFGIWNGVYTIMRLQKGTWSFYSGKDFEYQNIKKPYSPFEVNYEENLKDWDDRTQFDQGVLSLLKSNPMYLHVKNKWEDSGESDKMKMVSDMDDAVKAIGEYQGFYSVFSISERFSGENESELKKLSFDDFIFINRSQFRYIWLVLLRYFWDKLYQKAYVQMIDRTFKVKTTMTSSTEQSSSPPSSSETNKEKYPDLLDKTLEKFILNDFVLQVLQMKKDVFPLKHHMGLIFFEVLKELNPTKRTSLEELRDFAQGQYYSIVSQGKETFGVESLKKNIPDFPTQNPQENTSDSLQSEDSNPEISDAFNFKFDLDFIIKVRRLKRVIKIVNGKAVAPGVENDVPEFNSGTMMRRGTQAYAEVNLKLFGETTKIKKLFTDNKAIRQVKKLGGRLKCLITKKRKSDGLQGQTDETGTSSDEVVDVFERHRI
jgi:hypothetical protein